MKKLYLLCLTYIVSLSITIAQTPELINFQAIISSEEGTLDSTEVSLIFNIVKDNPESGETIYSESHDLTTDANGMIHLKIGDGNATSGSFNDIPWGQNSIFLLSKFSTDGENYELLSSSQLVSVPYALHSNTAENLKADNLKITGNGENIDFFEIRNNNYSRVITTSANDNLEPTAAFFGNRSSGSLNSPSNIKSQQRITGIYGRSYASGKYFVNAAMELVAGEQAGSNGVSSYIKFGTTNIGSIERTEKMRIAENGNVGIGTVEPSYKLDVNGSINTSELFINGELVNFNASSEVTKPISLTGPGTNVDMITVKNDNYSRIASYSANDNLESVANFVGFRSSGTNKNPTNIQENQRISGLYGSSYASGKYFVNAAMELVAGEQAGSNGVSSYIKFGTTNIGSIERTEKMRIAENGNVGIGTTSPEYKLDVKGSINADELYLNGQLFQPYDSKNSIDLVGNGENIDLLTLKNDNYSRIRSYSANDNLEATNLFVGHRSAGTIQSPSNIMENQRIVGMYGSSYANGNYFVNAAVELIAGEESGSNGVSSYIKFGTTNVGQIERTEKVRIAEDGNVGIGTSAPKSKLQVADGDVYIEDAASGVIMTSPDGNCWRMTVDNSGNPQFTSTTCPQ